ncbi:MULTISPECIES: hypothetical protein [Methylobacterium]|uniref:HPt domain-containing protein n=1 Tax=Methylobacterium jeotgali TaxID=381630 RepID=A0ABQ4SSN3_9HYPH|nr:MULTISPECIES: hypothetical protein [Methylobacterium]PIU15984.1 MAG: hypothetical protein COT28_02480 [Methylobacterium sp. CG08_land_8_20_14_0_20_71_15]GBU19920.1 hypothetical protein AwMethylo_41350 [Methylobacterium sp.]GJE04863.1 hypothetical protein AOPFMNJM_0155 [Methylobacterium jeotgali]
MPGTIESCINKIVRDASLTPHAGVVDRDALREIEGLVGRARVDALLGALHNEIRGRLLADGLESEPFCKAAHGLVYASATLGFSALSRACIAVEAAYRTGTEFETRRREAREAAESALAALLDLRQAA